MKNDIKVYAVLNEDRGGDTEVTLHANYKDAKKTFNSIVKDIKDCFSVEGLKDINCWNLGEDFLAYDLISCDSWGNIRIYKKSFKIDDFLSTSKDHNLSTERNQIVNNFLSKFLLITGCCKEPVNLNIYLDEDNNLGLDIREICFNCLDCNQEDIPNKYLINKLKGAENDK